MSAQRLITAQTRVAAVIGEPVRHSLSPILHNAAYAALGVDITYNAFEVREGETRAALHGARALGLIGLSVTTPHKDVMALACDQRTTRVERIGAANTITFEAGVSVGDSTDGQGLLADLDQACDFRPEGRRCGLIGAGGAARAIAYALGQAGASEVVVVNRTASNAARCAEIAGPTGRAGAPEDLGALDLVVNGTSLGFVGGEQEAQAARLLASSLQPGQLVVDLVYRPPRTAFLLEAAQRGARVHNGLGMLVHQAAEQVKLFTGQDAPLEAMWAALEGHGVQFAEDSPQ